MIDASDNNPNEFWKLVNSLKDKRDDPSSNVSAQDWSAYFKKLMNKKYSTSYSASDVKECIENNNSILNNDISAEELVRAVKVIKNNKSTGLDNVSNEMIKASTIVYRNFQFDIEYRNLSFNVERKYYKTYI